MATALSSAERHLLLILPLLGTAVLVAASPAAAQGRSDLSKSHRGTSIDAPVTSAQQDAIDRYVTAEMARQRIPGLALGVYRHGPHFT